MIDAAFLGAQRTIRLDTGAGGQFIAMTRAGGTGHAPGTQVELRWHPEDAWALPATRRADGACPASRSSTPSGSRSRTARGSPRASGCPRIPAHGSAPAILEAIPYRRRDGTLTIDQGRYAWWAERGFAGVRLDLRGTGDSEGLIEDEYLELEQLDIAEAIAWIAEQPWSNGRVGMIGYSWGGFNGLQVAARRPAALGAVVTVNSTVRRYTDDCHYTGGSVNAHDMLSWATTMLAFDARPPTPRSSAPAGASSGTHASASRRR